ncbi:hypothetical protein Lal_00031354 [Lupinus albus]|nr:hypothetical protein Lal_00031354 [Lupinus albus]
MTHKTLTLANTQASIQGSYFFITLITYLDNDDSKFTWYQSTFVRVSLLPLHNSFFSSSFIITLASFCFSFSILSPTFLAPLY